MELARISDHRERGDVRDPLQLAVVADPAPARDHGVRGSVPASPGQASREHDRRDEVQDRRWVALGSPLPFTQRSGIR